MPHDPTPLHPADELMTGRRPTPSSRTPRPPSPGSTRSTRRRPRRRPWWRRALATGLPPLVALAAVPRRSGSWSGRRRSTDEYKVPAPLGGVARSSPRPSPTARSGRSSGPRCTGRCSVSPSPRSDRDPARAAGGQGARGAGRDRAAAAGPAEPAVGGLGARRGALVRADRRHDLLRRAARLDPVDRQRAGRRASTRCRRSCPGSGRCWARAGSTSARHILLPAALPGYLAGSSRAGRSPGGR